MAEASHWFERRRGIAVTVAATGSYIGGTLWPPIVSWGILTFGWRSTHISVGVVTTVLMLLMLVVLRAQMGTVTRRSHVNAPPPKVDLQLSNNTLTTLLFVAGIGCCVAMAMPQVHIVAYCGDLGYGVTRGAEMLSLMLACGIVSRVGSGFLADRIGGIRTLLIGSLLQGFALLFYLFFDSLASLYIISAMFGLFQGGLVPAYAIIIREAMPASQAATRVGIVILGTVGGMSLGGWMSGVIFDATGSYAAAFMNGLAWNALNVTIITALMLRARRTVDFLARAHRSPKASRSCTGGIAGNPSIGTFSSARLAGPLPNMQSSVGSAIAVMVRGIKLRLSGGSQFSFSVGTPRSVTPYRIASRISRSPISLISAVRTQSQIASGCA